MLSDIWRSQEVRSVLAGKCAWMLVLGSNVKIVARSCGLNSDRCMAISPMSGPFPANEICAWHQSSMSWFAIGHFCEMISNLFRLRQALSSLVISVSQSTHGINFPQHAKPDIAGYASPIRIARSSYRPDVRPDKCEYQATMVHRPHAHCRLQGRCRLQWILSSSKREA
jgi:hypothetical protein